MFGRRTCLGLDIGSKKIKMVLARSSGRKISVIRMVEVETPPGSVDTGTIVDPEAIAVQLRPVVLGMRLKGRRVVSAVSGQQIYTRTLVMPAMKPEELREAVTYQAASFLPISLDEAAMDVCPVHRFEDQDGPKVATLFVAVRRQQVESLETVCRLSGLKLVAVEIQPLALYRVCGGRGFEVEAFLNVGAGRSDFAVFRQGALVYLRSWSIGSSAVYQLLEESGALGRIDLEDLGAATHSGMAGFMQETADQVARSLQYYEMQKDVRPVERIWLTGSGARIREFDAFLANALGREVTEVRIADKVVLGHKVTRKNRRDLIYEYTVALGLAARGGA